MGADTPIGQLPKFPKEEVARLGDNGLMAGDDMIVGGDDDLRSHRAQPHHPGARQGRSARPPRPPGPVTP